MNIFMKNKEDWVNDGWMKLKRWLKWIGREFLKIIMSEKSSIING